LQGDGLAAVGRARILNCGLDLCDYAQALERITVMVASGQPHQVVTLNPEMVQYAQRDESFMALVNQADLITADGISIVWAARKMGYAIEERVTGVDLVGHICRQGARSGWKVYLLGSAPGVAHRAAECLRQRYPGLTVCGCHDGYFSAAEEPALLSDIIGLQPDILLVGLGSPRQEFWIREHMEALRTPAAIGIGGSLDVISGLKKRAPRWMIAGKLEWLYRLLSEPKRIRRYVHLPVFVLQVLRAKKNR
jgi:N-acetylglucosaminyldiphosphoundecaprenol N-acetyl-beta-D-mannosaminyltransferase